MRSRQLLTSALLLLATVTGAGAQYARPTITKGVGIDQNLNAPVPLDLVFRDENDQVVPLRTYFGDKPVVIEMVYFGCTSLCPKSVYETVSALKRVSLEPGRDYDVVVVSFDPRETPTEAANEKMKYAQIFGRKSFFNGWHFLTGSQGAIDALTKAVGFHYRYDEPSKQFVHAGGIMVATPEGRLSRYFYGIQYAPQDLRMALVDAAKHRIGTPVDYVLLFCFHYDATLGKYTLAIFNLLKVAGTLTLLSLIGLIYFLMRNDKNTRSGVAWKEVRHVG